LERVPPKSKGKPWYLYAIVAFVLLILLLTVYAGTWPPFSVVESESMEHGPSWTPGVINTGDIVLVKKVNDPQKNVITYVVGRTENLSKNYGEYGDVILYHAPNGLTIIHRAIFYLQWKNGNPVVDGYDGQSWIHITKNYILIDNVGYSSRNLVVFLSSIENESGFITVGDYNLAHFGIYVPSLNAYRAADQDPLIFGFPPVKPSQVEGIAFGQIPWFGLIKLNIMRLFGEWPDYNEVPRYAYDYLALSLAGIFTAVFFPYGKVIRKRKK
jgi:signal peptidase